MELRDPLDAITVPQLQSGRDPLADLMPVPDERVPTLREEIGLPESYDVDMGGAQTAYEMKQKNDARLQSLQQAFGENFDPSDTFGEGFGDFITQADIARSQRPVDVERKFKSKYPEGDIQAVIFNGDPVWVGRKTPVEKFRELGMAPRVAGSLINEPTILGAMGPLGASTVGGAALMTGLSTAGGKLLQQGIEGMRGYGDGISPKDAAAEGGVAAGMTGLMGAGARLMGMRPRTVRGANMDRGIIAAEQEGLEPLVWGQVSDSPLIRSSYRQVGATSQRVANTQDAQTASLLKAVQKQVDEGLGVSGLTDDALQDIVNAQHKELSQIIQPESLTRVSAGEALQTGAKTYKAATARLADRYYNKAAEYADGIQFDVRGARDEAARILKGTEGMSIAGDGVRVSAPARGEFKDALESVAALKSPIADFNDKNAYEILKEARTRFFDLKHSDDPMVRREAGKMWSELTKAMDNPAYKVTDLPGDAKLTQKLNQDFVKANNRARDFWRVREENLEKSFVARALATDTPEKIAATYFRPGNTTALTSIKEIIPKPQWKTFTKSFQTDLMSAKTGREALTRLDNFAATDPDGLRLLMSPMEEKLTRKYLTKKMQFEASPARKFLQKNMTEAERAVGLMQKGSVADVADLVRLSGGRNSPQAQSLKAGVYKNILDQARDTTSSGNEIIEPRLLMKAIADWKKTGKLDELFSDADWARIENFNRYASPLTETTDIGGGMMRGQLSQELVSAPTDLLTDAKKILTPLKKIYSNEVTAWMLSRPVSSRLPSQPLVRGLWGATAGLTEFQRELEKQERELKKSVPILDRLKNAI